MGRMFWPALQRPARHTAAVADNPTHETSDRFQAGNEARLTSVDLSLFQVVADLRCAFAKRMNAFERRIPFDEDGIFRHYKELEPYTATAQCLIWVKRRNTRSEHT